MRHEDTAFEKRRAHRIRLYAPIEGRTSEGAVVLIDLSDAGARVEHPFRLEPGHRIEVTLKMDEKSAIVSCDVLRCKLQKSSGRDAIVYSSGLKFCDGQEETISLVVAMIAQVARQDLEARQVYAAQGTPE